MQFKKIFISLTPMIAAIILFSSCNKDVPAAVPIVPPMADTSQPTIATLLNDPSFSILKAAVTKAGLIPLLSDRKAVFTFFAPDDAAMAASGFSLAVVNFYRAGQLDTLFRYHIVGGQALTGSIISASFPNTQEPSMFVLQAPSASLPPGFRMPIFPSKRGNAFWANNIPLTQVDLIAANGVIHKTATLVAPPQAPIKPILAANPAKYSLLLEAIKRADSAQVGLGRLDSVINYAPANVTLFAPNNDAFRAWFPMGTPDANIIATFNNPAAFTAQTMRGIIAYHLLGSRAFSVNFSAGPAPVNTQLVIPPTGTIVPVFVTYGGATFTVKGLANATASNVVTRDTHAINGVIHEIDQVLKPQ